LKLGSAAAGSLWPEQIKNAFAQKKQARPSQHKGGTKRNCEKSAGNWEDRAGGTEEKRARKGGNKTEHCRVGNGGKAIQRTVRYSRKRDSDRKRKENGTTKKKRLGKLTRWHKKEETIGICWVRDGEGDSVIGRGPSEQGGDCGMGKKDFTKGKRLQLTHKRSGGKRSAVHMRLKPSGND